MNQNRNDDPLQFYSAIYSQPVMGELVSQQKIHYEVFKSGYYHDPVLGKLRPHTVSRGTLIVAAVITIIVFLTMLGAANMRSAIAQADAVKAQMQVSQLRQAMADQRAIAQANLAQLNQCASTLNAYQSRMAQLEQSVQQQPASNPNATIAMAILKVLRAAL